MLALWQPFYFNVSERTIRPLFHGSSVQVHEIGGGFMLTTTRIKQLFEDENMSEEEATEILNSLTGFVRKILDKWIQLEVNLNKNGTRKQ